ncbi:MAG: DHA2 family efflux MFS transporter permease subunit [Deltaproteobacteria bacterium]|nr:DHA2 family efflux MFS transporter permease subunit [Deltaproteobacteria bacterium]
MGKAGVPAGPATATDALPPLRGARLALLTLALALGTFMQVLDATIANVAVPTIAGNLGVSSSQGTWVITSYGVANAIGIPVTGWLARRFGEVRLFIWTVMLFALASLLCGLATGLAPLVVFRVIQGAVAGPMMPLSQSLLLTNYPPAKRGMAIALWGMTTSVAPVCGPILGGYISDNFHWGWIFFINVPLGILVAWLSWSLLRGRESETGRQPTNYVGLALLVLGVGALQMMLDRGKELDWFNSGEIVTLAVAAVVGLSFLVVWELTDKRPIIDFSLFRSRNFTIGVVCISLGMMVYLASVVLLPLLLQTQLGYTATLAGLAAAPIGFFPIVLAPFVGRNAHRVDLRLLVSISFLVFAACFYMRTFFFPQMDFGFVVFPQFVQGIALALFFTPLTAMAFAELEPRQMAAGAGLFNFFRQLCGSIGVSVATTLWERREALHHTHLTEHITPYNPLALESLELLQRQGLSELQSAGYLAREITRQGFVLGANEVFWLCALALLALIPVVWLAKSAKKAA